MSWIGRKIDITGKRFGRLTVLKRDECKSGYWICQCDCGSEPKIIRKDHLVSGDIIACGCQMYSRIGNQYKQKDGYIEGKLTNTDDVFLIDAQDYNNINKYTWYVDNSGYVATSIKKKKVYMHRLIMDCKTKEEQVDHINHNTIDNRRSNLRIVDNSKNQMNKRIRKDNKSGYKGVYWSKSNNKWIAQITKDNDVIYLGAFDNKDEAKFIRNKAESEMFGEYAYKCM